MILDRILADKRIEIADRKARTPQELLRDAIPNAPPVRDFKASLSGDRIATTVRGRRSDIAVIAEVKKASPSKGLIRADFDPVSIARVYESAGASAISVLTDDKYFQGALEYLSNIRSEVSLPLLRKDFIIDSYQIYEARVAGADAVLLIVAALGAKVLSELIGLAAGLGMSSLVEVHTAEELETAIEARAEIIGINNRDLQTFSVRLDTTLDLACRVPPDRILVSESGISTRQDVIGLMEAGVDAVLVGESLMRERDPSLKLRELLGMPL